MTDENRHVFVVFTNSVEGQDDEFNRWYDERHIHDIVGIDGFVSGQRFELNAEQRPGQMAPPWKYMALYEVVGDVPALHDRVKESGPTFLKSAALKQDHVAWVFSYVGDRIEPPTATKER